MMASSLSLADPAASLEPADLPRPSGNAVVRRFESLACLSQDDRGALFELLDPWEWVPAGRVIDREGDAPGVINALLSGIACRHKDFSDGRRQIIAILLPGDMARDPAGALRPADHHVRTLTRAKVVKIPARRFGSVVASHPGIERALEIAAVLEAALLRAWIVNLGQRRAHERLAHLLCEIAHRMITVDLRRPDGSFELPLTQKDLGMALGLSSVHVNRVLQQLRAEPVLEFAGGVLRIHDLARLEAIANFDRAYLSHRH